MRVALRQALAVTAGAMVALGSQHLLDVAVNSNPGLGFSCPHTTRFGLDSLVHYPYVPYYGPAFRPDQLLMQLVLVAVPSLAGGVVTALTANQDRLRAAAQRI